MSWVVWTPPAAGRNEPAAASVRVARNRRSSRRSPGESGAAGKQSSARTAYCGRRLAAVFSSRRGGWQRAGLSGVAATVRVGKPLPNSPAVSGNIANLLPVYLRFSLIATISSLRGRNWLPAGNSLPLKGWVFGFGGRCEPVFDAHFAHFPPSCIRGPSVLNL